MNNTDSKPNRFTFFDELDRGLNHLVNEVLQGDHSRRDVPPLSVYEFADHYIVECDLPGVRLEEIDLQFNDGVLEISGERKAPFVEGQKVTVNERSFASFSRKLQVSKDVNLDGVDAELCNGVLKVSIPKAASVLPKTINIRKVGDGQ